MPYIRQHGAQLALVHGERNKTTGSVEQKILFSLYSQEEAWAAIGKKDARDRERFRALIKETYPSIKFNWTKLTNEIETKISHLPETYEKKSTDLGNSFESSMKTFARELMLSNPNGFHDAVANKLINQHRSKLLVLKELIEQTLENCSEDRLPRLALAEEDLDPSVDEFTNDEFAWHYLLRGTDCPLDMEEWGTSAFEKLDYRKARAIFEMLVDCFDNYAEGHNYLGLIALREDRIDDAIAEFELTAKIGRNLFPRSIAKKSYWSKLSTRPYMRGLRNLIYALKLDARYDEALLLTHKLERECGDQVTAEVYRASIYLSLSKWNEATELALKNIGWSKEEGFVAGFALYELGDKHKAVEAFLHAALNHPHTARLILDLRKPKPTNNMAIEDHNGGIEMRKIFGTYLKDRRNSAPKFFRSLGASKSFIELMEKVDTCTENHMSRDKFTRENFDEWHRMQELSYAKQQAKRLLKEVPV